MRYCCDLSQAAMRADDRCRRCGEKGRRVLRQTMESLLKPDALERLLDQPYYFDHTPECDVVYFSNEANSYFHKDNLTVRVSLKETESPILLCYCFRHTAESVREEIVARGRSTVPERITEEVQAGHCSCEVKNPSGRCCLGDVNRAIRQIQKELQPEEPLKEPLARMAEG